MPTLPDESSTDLAGVEIIEASPFELAGSESTSSAEPIRRTPDGATKVAAAAAVCLVLAAAFVILTRPGPEDRVENNERAQTTVVPTTTTTAPPTTDAAESAATLVELRPIPSFDVDLPEDLPGVISGLDQRGSMVVVNRALPRPIEHELGINVTEEGSTLLGLPGGRVVRVDRELIMLGNQLVVEDAGALLRDTIDVFQFLPDRSGGVLIVDSMGTRNVATLHTLAGAGESEGQEFVWGGLSGGLDIVGTWGESLVVRRAGQTWLLPTEERERPPEEGEPTLVAEGELLSYDGLHIVRMSCSGVASCELVVGTPDAPELSRVVLPDLLEEVSIEEWAGSLAVSPDGTQLALAARNGGISLPMIIDLTTGEFRQLADGMNNRSPVAWSPDGQWLAYTFSNDVMVWNLEVDRSRRITLNRELKTLMWR